MGERIQTIRLTLADGRQGYFSGAVIGEESDIEGMRVIAIDIFPPRALPPDCHVETISLFPPEDCEVGG